MGRVVTWVRHVSPAQQSPVLLAWNKVSSLQIKKGLLAEKTYPEKNKSGQNNIPKMIVRMPRWSQAFQREAGCRPCGLTEVIGEFRGT